MRKTVAATVAMVGVLGVSAVLAASGAAKGHTISIRETVSGAEISATQTVFKIHDSYSGNGAGVQNIKVSGSKVTEKTVAYYQGGTGDATGTIKVGTANAKDISTLTGSGKDTGGTGTLKGLKGSYTLSGTINTKTLVYHATLKATITLG